MALRIEDMKARNLIVVACTHDLAWVRRAADQVIYVEKGSIKASGPLPGPLDVAVKEMSAREAQVR